MSLHVHLVPSLAGVSAGAGVSVEGAEAHHAVAVRRLAVGEPVQLTDGSGRLATGSVVATGKARLEVLVAEVAEVPAPSPRVTVVQALPKGDRGELAVEVLTEIGVDRIVPWAASRSVAVWRGERAAKSLAKWQATAREAAKQARRAWFPSVTPLASTDEVAALVAEASLALVLHEEATSALPASVPDDVLLVVGPEGGLAPEELEAFAAAGAQTVRLGAEVLRTSTAGVAAVAALLARTPRWG
ncbi:16S rRNA (uracil(1498)-N(3))-methyltransferase [Nocardioides anomalus]|uniref:Ribosomal RNA small subunit methyltransferase E n=1 Tax=Nocardioides anomalus TaxID=2712223 RepID=A0A6G6WBZ5_9ACTN|nr:16S rRNA (uracil(1498)-N(3))-methyltransferase [Nocardioides anomalus]QIG42726.1 16S rRNA (uracil(1498)-N(3))-methyltransferase [Nocardioides anomalus]